MAIIYRCDHCRREQPAPLSYEGFGKHLCNTCFGVFLDWLVDYPPATKSELETSADVHRQLSVMLGIGSPDGSVELSIVSDMMRGYQSRGGQAHGLGKPSERRGATEA